jgi:hypothetical protein
MFQADGYRMVNNKLLFFHTFVLSLIKLSFLYKVEKKKKVTSHPKWSLLRWRKKMLSTLKSKWPGVMTGLTVNWNREFLSCLNQPFLEISYIIPSAFLRLWLFCF